jgi:predicted alpha-1,2-mannosidase
MTNFPSLLGRRIILPVVPFLTILFLLSPQPRAAAQGAYESVNPFIGTAGDGNTFPGASLPFGMMQWSPDTTDQGWYFYKDKTIHGFSLTHLSGAGCPLYGDVPVLPWSAELTGSPATHAADFALAFDHAHEEAHPGFYSVTLNNGVAVALAVAERSGLARFQFPAGQPARLLINPGGSANSDVHVATLPPVGREHDGSSVRLTGHQNVSGSVTSGGFCGSPTRYTLYFAAKFSKPFTHFSTWQDEALSSGKRESAGRHTGAWLDFSAGSGDARREITMKIAISYVSEANAAANLDREIPGWNFDEVRSRAQQTWSTMLDHIRVEGGTRDQRTIFYTGLYHMLLAPSLFSDENGDYIGFDQKVHSLAGTSQKAQYANYSDWDIYRNTIQLQSLLVPARAGDMMQSLVNDAAQSGYLPKWPAANDVTYVMGGDSPAVLLASAWAFGARNFDAQAGLRYSLKAAFEPGKGPHDTEERPGLADLIRLGYVPLDHDSSAASHTLEYATDDFAVAQLARGLGDAASAQKLEKRAGNWQNLFDPETRWIRPRLADGAWMPGFDAEKSLPHRDNAPVSTDQNGFEEGNTYQYTFMIPFDYPGLFQHIGSEAEVNRRLDHFFSKLICWGEPCFNMANEPDFVTPYAYLFSGEPWKTQQVLTRIEKETFRVAPDGIPGNDDLGATSGVYVWNALGLYPGIPGVGGLLVGTPMFDSATLELGADQPGAARRLLTVRAKGNGPFVNSVALDGHPLQNFWLPLSSLPAGNAELAFTLQGQPDTHHGQSAAERPPAFVHQQ